MTAFVVDAVRWRLNDPGQEQRERWTKVHRLPAPEASRMLCGTRYEEYAYMMDFGPDIPEAHPVCSRCAAIAERQHLKMRTGD